jgi:cholesterol transport system auxiliary component
MKALARIVLVGALIAAVAGCLSPGPRESQRNYVLESSGAEAVRAQAARASTLLVAPATASSFYESQDIVYSRAPGTRAYYQYHSWAERPSRRIYELLVARLERSGAFEAVAAIASGVRGELVLSTHLAEFYHDATTSPGSAQIVLTAELTDPVRRVLIARRTFRGSAPAETYDAPGAVQAFNKSIAAVLDDISAWVDNAAPR